MNAEVGNEIKSIMDELENEAPGATEGVGAIIGSSAGGAASLAALSTLGISGLSAAGITTGLATAGGIIGGGMVAGIGVLAAPVAILGIAGYAIANRRKKAKTIAALNVAIERLFELQERLMNNARYYMEELASVKALVSALKQKLHTVNS